MSITRQQEKLDKELASRVSHDELSKQLSRMPGKRTTKLVCEQELHLESNETMFAMLVEELKELKLNQESLADSLSKKHKASLVLSNEVCEKLEAVDREIASLYVGCDLENEGSNARSSTSTRNPKQFSTRS